MSVAKLVCVGLTLAMTLYLLNRLGRNETSVYAAVGAAVLLSMGMTPMREAVGTLLPLGRGVGEDALSSVAKALSIGHLCGISADLCEDLGQAAISRALVFGGRALIFSLSVPYIVTLFRFCEELLL
jgi:hypothetical protein